MAPDLHVRHAQRTGNHSPAFLRLWVDHPKQIIRQPFAEAAMQLTQPLDGCGAAIESAFIDPCLHGNVSFGFELEVTLLGIAAVVALEGPLDIDRMGIVPLDQIRSEEHTSELQSLMRISYAVFCLKKKTN